LPDLRELADKVGALLIYDEVQTGIGRTGRLFAYEHSGVAPDIMTLAKGLGGGVAIGCMIATDDVFTGFVVGSHASTFGGNPLACAAAEVVLEFVTDEAFLRRVREVGEALRSGLRNLDSPIEFREVRGLGLMVGVEVGPKAKEIVVAARERGLLINVAGADTLRFVPPLIATEADVEEALGILKAALVAVAKAAD
jgi:acetylornithine/succinyldiaminopimelate/putrescine aminotransferase